MFKLRYFEIFRDKVQVEFWGHILGRQQPRGVMEQSMWSCTRRSLRVDLNNVKLLNIWKLCGKKIHPFETWKETAQMKLQTPDMSLSLQHVFAFEMLMAHPRWLEQIWATRGYFERCSTLWMSFHRGGLYFCLPIWPGPNLLESLPASDQELRVFHLTTSRPGSFWKWWKLLKAVACVKHRAPSWRSFGCKGL